MATPGCMLVLAEVKPELWADFNRWYSDIHMPEAVKRLRARKALRLVDRSTPCRHIAIYYFDDMEQFESETIRSELEALVREFNDQWREGVARERRFVDIIDEHVPVADL
ncbi:hypothetical protein J2Y48_000263 [Mycoplana sp. BE70]|uniref:DUF4286 family protein n=1 Tax=Mycoplana sp. BE70 TaxID=2817775 RepID=UPI002861A71F|nr:DUF4286 family protein [Mycoplana sp. BE70]MDR6754990.1 hypothetical protein [Mycoplana sp. BE70]